MSPENMSALTVSQPGQIISLIEECMAARIAPGRNGWSTTWHLRRDLQRMLGVVVPEKAMEQALVRLAKRGRIRRRLDEDGRLWVRIEM